MSYIVRVHIGQTLHFQIGVHVPILKEVKFIGHIMSLNANYETFFIRGVAHTTKDG